MREGAPFACHKTFVFDGAIEQTDREQGWQATPDELPPRECAGALAQVLKEDRLREDLGSFEAYVAVRGDRAMTERGFAQLAHRKGGVDFAGEFSYELSHCFAFGAEQGHHRKWDGGWELHIDDEGVTQVRTLDKAVDQVRDYLETRHDTDFSTASVEVIPDLNGLEREIIEARHEIEEAAQAQVRAAEHSRRLARALREKGLSVTDTAAVLGVSRGRVSQLVH